MNTTHPVSDGLKNAIRFFTYYFANQSLAFVTGVSKLNSVPYVELLHEIPSNVEMMYSIFTNNIQMDAAGNVLNFEHSAKRAAQFIATCIYFEEGPYIVEPPFEEWELTFY